MESTTQWMYVLSIPAQKMICRVHAIYNCMYTD